MACSLFESLILRRHIRRIDFLIERPIINHTPFFPLKGRKLCARPYRWSWTSIFEKYSNLHKQYTPLLNIFSNENTNRIKCLRDC